MKSKTDKQAPTGFSLAGDAANVEWVMWATLTSTNGSSPRTHRRAVQAFTKRLSAITRTSPYVMLGGDHGRNIHSHLLVGVEPKELEVYFTYYRHFGVPLSWKNKHSWVKDFCPVNAGGMNAPLTKLYLIKEDHTYQRSGWVCLNRSSVCKNRNCVHKKNPLKLTAY